MTGPKLLEKALVEFIDWLQEELECGGPRQSALEEVAVKFIQVIKEAEEAHRDKQNSS